MFSIFFFFFNDTATTEIYTFPTRRSSDLNRPGVTRGRLGDVRRHADLGPARRQRAVQPVRGRPPGRPGAPHRRLPRRPRSEEHTSELQSLAYLVCRLLLEKKKNQVSVHIA